MTPEVSIILPCRNEEDALPRCLDEAAAAIRASGLCGEIVAVDNASTDATPEILRARAARAPELVVAHEPVPGYGSAYRRGLSVARGEVVFMADADGSYRLGDLSRFVAAIRAGADLAIGDRFARPMEPGAMPWMHRHVGNPALSALTRLLFRAPVRDVHCGARAARRSALASLGLETSGMEFASEMVVRAARAGLRFAEVPTAYRPRLGRSKLRPVADGLRHLRYLALAFARPSPSPQPAAATE